jgi:molybdopterin synthase catalytic subunit
MQIDVELTDVPIVGSGESRIVSGEVGAWTEFRGLVRAEENGVAIRALEYEAYRSMAERELRRLLEALSRKHSCLGAQVIHRIGVVPVGDAAIYVGIASRHRGEGYSLLAEFMDRLKQDVPIWKCRSHPA